ncbi:hypothetical protein INT47_012524 [Mucor saturninus]|uniref:Uncharacterized protein n=1 Tax=Mucor saturninus TaxID=64648 RepID=A0A8H7UUV0_9FUNG|nr:hypothetical protein INT47_012524 [Mucor saturninus]
MGRAAPSGKLGLGDTGASNTDSSQNLNIVTTGDSAFDGQQNKFDAVKGVNDIRASYNPVKGVDPVGRIYNVAIS